MSLAARTVSLRSVNSVSSARPYTPLTFAFTQVKASLRPLFFSVPSSTALSASACDALDSLARPGSLPAVSI